MINEAGEPQSFPSAADVDAVLQEFDGDHRAAIAALLHDVAALAADYGLSVSRGYVRRGTSLFVKVAGRGVVGPFEISAAQIFRSAD